MRMLRSYRVLRFAMVLLAIAAQCAALQSLSMLLVAGTLASVSWYVTEGPRGRSLPPWVARLLVLAAMLAAAVEGVGPIEQLPPALGTFVVWLTIIKLYDRRTIEKESQLLLLSLLLMVTGGLYASDLLFGILMILWSLLGGWVLLLYHLHHGTESMRQERYAAVPVAGGTPWTRPATGGAATGTLRRTGSLLLVVGFGVAAICFVLLPRGVNRSEEDALNMADAGVSRLSLAPERAVTSLGEQVMSVRLIDPDGESIKLPQALRLRGSVLERYRGEGIWEAGERHYQLLLSKPNEMTRLPGTGFRRSTIRLEVTLQRPTDQLYSLHRPLAVEAGQFTRVLYDPAFQTVQVMASTRRLRYYAIDVYPEEQMAGASDAPETGFYDNPRVAALAASLLDDAQIDAGAVVSGDAGARMRAANAFVAHLTSGAFSYSTGGVTLRPDRQVDIAEASDPAELFLLATRSGHCEFFAASMAAMCDTIGLPARVVTGYLTDRFDPATRQYIVLDSDAHAWVEVEMAPGTWRTFDPTPASPGSPTQGSRLSWADSLHFAWERWQTNWQVGVLGYDRRTQRYLLDRFDPYWKEPARAAIGDVRRAAGAMVGWFNIGAGGRTWVNLVLLSVIAAGCAGLAILRRRRGIRVALRLGDGDVQGPLSSIAFFARALAIVSKHGCQRPTWQPPLAWAQRSELPAGAAPLLCDLAQSFYAIRFGGHRPDRALLQALDRQVDALAVALEQERL